MTEKKSSAIQQNGLHRRPASTYVIGTGLA